MALRIIDIFESIEIEKHERKADPVPVGLRDDLLKPIAQHGTVGQPREVVAISKIAQPLLRNRAL